MSGIKPGLATKSEIIRYSFGGFGSNVLFFLQLSFLMYFYTDVFGVSPAAVGTLFLGVRILDALFDPVMGMLSDRMNTRWGKYRPFLIFGSPLLAAVTILLFTAPQLDASGKIVYAAFTYLCYSLISSVVNVPYHSLTAVMSKDANQTTAIASAKQFMALPAQIVVTAAVLPMVAFFGSGRQGWLTTAVILGIIAVASFWICASGVKRHDVQSDPRHAEHQHPPLKTQLNLIVQNKPLLILMFSMFLNLAATTTNSTVAVYFWQYNVNNVQLYSQISLWGLLLSTPMYAMIPYFAKKNREAKRVSVRQPGIRRSDADHSFDSLRERARAIYRIHRQNGIGPVLRGDCMGDDSRLRGVREAEDGDRRRGNGDVLDRIRQQAGLGDRRRNGRIYFGGRRIRRGTGPESRSAPGHSVFVCGSAVDRLYRHDRRFAILQHFAPERG